MGKAEERCWVDRVELCEESVSEYGLRVCPWLSVMSRWLRAYFILTKFADWNMLLLPF